MQRSSRQSRGLVALVVILALSAMIGSWAHAAVHAGESRVAPDCASCQWVKHSPMVAAPAPEFATLVVAGPAEVVAAPLAAPRLVAAARNTRAPPRTV